MDFSAAKGSIRFHTRKLLRFAREPMHFPPYPQAVRDQIEKLSDDVRYSTLALAIERIEAETISGAFAELGVYRGHTSKFMHQLAPDRHLYLFDTFQGFPTQIANASQDIRFRDTSKENVARFIGNLDNVTFRVGYFPETAAGLENERFALVMIDCDIYEPAVDGLRFFYPRLVPGGYLFLHDFNSPESDHAIERAVTGFMADKPEGIIEIPDHWGSAVLRKLRKAT